MKDEIKEHMQNCVDREESCLLNSDNTKLLLDCITNLQEENKDLKYSNIYLSKTCDRYKITVRNYKSRNEKAVEYIKNTIFWGIYKDTPMCEVKYGDELLNILTGGDK